MTNAVETPSDTPSAPQGAVRGEYRATVERIHDWRPETRSLFLRVAPGPRFVFTPGQFISLALPSGAAEPLVRAYSIASSPEDAPLLEICIDRVPNGPGSTHLFTLGPGAELVFKGPFGSFVVDEPPAAEMIFIADATCIAPIRPMVRRVLERGGRHPMHVMHGARSESELLFRRELEDAAEKHARLRYDAIVGTDAPSPLEAAVVDRYVRGDTDRTRHLWICGVGPWVRRLRDALRGTGYARRAVRYEQW